MTDVPAEANRAAPSRRTAKGLGRDAKEVKNSRRAPVKHGLNDASKLKIQIDLPGGARLGPGKVALLELIEAEGSLSRAAETMGISYRRAWLFMSQVNRAFDELAVATPEHGHGGGPARLTEFGRELIRHYRSIEQEAARSGAELLRWIDRHKSGTDGGREASSR